MENDLSQTESSVASLSLLSLNNSNSKDRDRDRDRGRDGYGDYDDVDIPAGNLDVKQSLKESLVVLEALESVFAKRIVNLKRDGAGRCSFYLFFSLCVFEN
jgi:hypothetical protein